jgi:hypothetical protein
MTAWLLSFGWNWLLVPVAAWFLNGLRKALFVPRVRLLQHTKSGPGFLVTLRRQQLLPPWQNLTETWYVLEAKKDCVREGDGRHENGDNANWDSNLALRICCALRVAKARETETEELLK